MWGKRYTILAVVTVVIALFNASIGGITEHRAALPGMGQLDAYDESRACSDNLESFQVDVNFSNPIILEYGRYIRISCHSDEDILLCPGMPMLPVVNIVVTIPLGSKIIDVNYVGSSYEKMDLPGKIMPAPMPFKINGKGVSSVCSQQCIPKLDESTYGSSSYFPSEWYSFHRGGGLLDGKRVSFLSIHVYPVRYAPRLDSIQYTRGVTVEVLYEKPETQSFMAGDGYDMLVISPSEFIGALRPLEDYKNSIGVSTKLVALEEITCRGRDTQEQIKYCIKQAIEDWGVTYVLLVGNRTKVPARVVDSGDIPIYPQFVTDLYYGDVFDCDGRFCSWDANNNSVFGELNDTAIVDGMDLYPDVYVGRLLCRNRSEVELVVNKTISYEENTWGKPWFKNLVVCGGDSHSMWKDIVFNLFLGGGIAREGEYIGDRVAENMSESGFNVTKLYASALFPFGDADAERLTVENINTAINKGAGFVVFSGHGNPLMWGTHPPSLDGIWLPFHRGYSTPDDLASLHNSGKLPIVVFDACSCGDYSNITGVPSPLAWDFVNKPDSGAVASYACTSLAFGYPGELTTQTCNGFVSSHLFSTYAAGVMYTGELLADTLTAYLNSQVAMSKYVPASMSVLCVEYWTLFGDPSLHIGGFPHR